MNILVSNDDGIRAVGIEKLVEALSKVADVFVAAPSVQMSASGHGITVSRPMVVKPYDFPNAKDAIEVSGTPADCVKIGIPYFKAKGIEIDMVYSGINLGANLGTDTLYSGTVSAAIEGNLNFKPAVAVSVGSHHATNFEYACELAVKAFHKAKEKLDNKTVLNINVPDIPYEEVKGVKYTKLGKTEYVEWYTKEVNEEGEAKVTYSGEPEKVEGDDLTIDLVANTHGYATITPLKYDLTKHDLIEEIKSWRID